MALMTDKRVRHLPVIDGGNLLGVLSIGYLVKSIISDREFVIEQLEHYIRSHAQPGWLPGDNSQFKKSWGFPTLPC
jgi:hypothetical protein